MKNRFNIISILLILCMLFQPFVPLFAENSNTDELSDAEAQFLEAYDQITALEEINVDECKGVIEAAGFCENVGHFFVNIGKGVYNLFVDDENEVEYDEYSDYIAQIEEANNKIVEAKAQAEAMKAAFDEGGIDAAKNADPSQVSQGSYETQLQAMDDARTALTDTGNCLKEVASVMSTISTIFSGLGTVLELIALIPGLGLPLAAVGLAFNLASDVLDPCAECLDSAGDGLIAAAQAGENSEAGTYAMDNFKHTAAEEAPKAALNIVLDIVSSDVTGLKEAALGHFDDVLDAGGNVSKYWDPAKGMVQDAFTSVAGNKMSEEAIKNASEIAVSIPRTINSMCEDFTGNPLYENPIMGVEDIGEKAVEGMAGRFADQVAPEYHEPDVNYEGDDEE